MDRVVDALGAGELVGLPTETVYGVAARADSVGAMQRLREFKNVGPDFPFTLHLPDAEAAIEQLDSPPASLRRVIRKALPGPITLRLPVNGRIVALRCPSHPLARRVLREAGGPVVAASVAGVNQRPALDAEAAAAMLGESAAWVLDGGRCRFGKPSTLIEYRPADAVHPSSTPNALPWTVKRVGVIDERMVRNMQTFNLLLVCTGNTCRSPMAEVLAQDVLAGQPDVKIGSAGVFAGAGQPASMEAVEAMQALGLDLSGHRSRPLTADLVNAADQIYTMTESHRQAVLAQAPHAADKVQRLDPEADISDPIGASLSVYQATADQIRRALESRLKEQLS